MSLFPDEDLLTKEIESWKGFTDCLPEEERRVFMKMLNDCYSLYAKQAMPFYIKNDFKISEIKNGDGDPSFYLMYRDLFPECVKLDKGQ